MAFECFSSPEVYLDVCSACNIGDVATVEKLVSCQGSHIISKRNARGWTPLMYASFSGHDSLVRWLLEKGVDVSDVDSSSGRTALMLAIIGGFDSVLQTLINFCGRNVTSLLDVQSADGLTALMYACSYGDVSAIEVLLAQGAGVNIRTREGGLTALMIACKKGHERVVRMLLKAGADPRAIDGRGSTALSISRENCFALIVELLQDALRESSTPSTTSAELPSSRLRHAVPPVPIAPVRSAETTSSERSSNNATMSVHVEHENVLDNQVHNYMRQVQANPEGSLNRGSVPQDPQPTSLHELLNQIGLPHYGSLFQASEIDLPTLLQLNDSDLKAIGISKLGPRRKLTNAISRWHMNGAACISSSVNPLEHALANYHRSVADDLKRTLEKNTCEIDGLQDQLEHERRMRDVLERSLATHKSSLQHVADNVQVAKQISLDLIRSLNSSSSPGDLCSFTDVQRSITRANQHLDCAMLKCAELNVTPSSSSNASSSANIS